MTNTLTLINLLNSYKLDDLRNALKENLREENLKATGAKTSDMTIIKRVLKRSPENNKAFKKAHRFERNGETYYGVMDGRYILSSKDDFSLEIAEEHERFKMESFLPSTLPNNSEKIDINELKVFCKEHKETKKTYLVKPYIIELNDKVIGINPHLLLDCLLFADSDTIYFDDIKSNCLKSPVFIENTKNNRLCLCLPVNIADNKNSIEYMNKWRNNEV